MVTEVVVGGPVSNNKGINLPGVAVSVPAMSEKDTDDLRWALRNGVDMVALSFVRSANDVEIVHQVMDEEGRRVPVIAKIEKPQAVENLDEIIDAFDAFMVARGDLGVELPLEEVPLVQKQIVTAARRWAKPVIVATQMLESMISAPRPTRAEASDVANAILDGADAVMLSGETSVGEYPVITVETMARIVDNTEQHGLDQMQDIDWDPHTTSGVITKAAAEVGERIDAKFLVAFTHSGDAARRLSRLRSSIPVLAFTPDRADPRGPHPELGRGVLPGPDGRPHRRHDPPGRQGPDRDRPDRRGRARRHRRRLPARGRRPHQHGPRPPDRRAPLAGPRSALISSSPARVVGPRSARTRTALVPAVDVVADRRKACRSAPPPDSGARSVCPAGPPIGERLGPVRAGAFCLSGCGQTAAEPLTGGASGSPAGCDSSAFRCTAA